MKIAMLPTSCLMEKISNKKFTLYFIFFVICIYIYYDIIGDYFIRVYALNYAW